MDRYKFVTSVLITGVFLLGLSFFLQNEHKKNIFESKHIIIQGKSWEIIGIADTDETRRRGLSHREKIAPQTGLLFFFPEAGKYSFWMKDMRFPIDIIFIRPDGTVDSVALNRQPDDVTPIFPEQSIKYVFEVNAGEGEGIQTGDRVDWK